jgi:uncharacterized protein YqhQ
VSSPTPVAYGGQAVIEGVMMRGAKHFAVACRKADGEIVVREEPVPAFFTRYAWARWPFFRGVFALADALVLGMKSLLFSADLAARDLPGPGQAEVEAARAELHLDPPATPPKSISGIAVPGTAAISIAFALCLFVLFPTIVAGWLKPLHPSGMVLNLVEGGLRIALVLGYIASIRRLKEVRRVFKYHGAEHKAINALENEGVVDVDAAMRQTTIHPRCGTNFVLTVLLVKVLIFSFLGWPAFWLRLGLRLALLPLVAAVAYEVIRLAGRYRNVAVLQALVLPGLLTQRLTTDEPEREMVEVAVAALRGVIAREQPEVAERTAEPLALQV